MYSHLYRNVHDKNPFKKKWIVISTEMYMTKTHTRIISIVIHTKMYMTKTHKNIDSHLYKDVHDENQIWVVIRIEMCMTKPIRIWIVIRTMMCMTKTKYG